MLTAYDKTLSRFEDIIREQRERRNNPNWNFCHYFLLQVLSKIYFRMLNLIDYLMLIFENAFLLLYKIILPLQEELAFALQMLGLYDEALVQYDELDALFTQFVLNSNVGGMIVVCSTKISVEYEYLMKIDVDTK
jgi:tetratricopeptide (TPR) repeat protein